MYTIKFYFNKWNWKCSWGNAESGMADSLRKRRGYAWCIHTQHYVHYIQQHSQQLYCDRTELLLFSFFLHFLRSHADIYYNFESLFFAENRLVALLQHNYHRICDFDMSILKLLFVYVWVYACCRVFWQMELCLNGMCECEWVSLWKALHSSVGICGTYSLKLWH